MLLHTFEVEVSITNMNFSAARPYRQTARADAAAATKRRILDSFVERMRAGWMEEITLDEVARDAGVTVQTVIRRFGGKEGLLAAAAERFGEEVMARRAPAAEGDWHAHVAVTFADYEVSGEFVLRLLAQEERWPALQPMLARGRAGHRNLILRLYRPWLEPLDPPARDRLVAGLVMLTDVYSWKLLRLDQGLGPDEAVALIQSLVGKLLGETGGPSHD